MWNISSTIEGGVVDLCRRVEWYVEYFLYYGGRSSRSMEKSRVMWNILTADISLLGGEEAYLPEPPGLNMHTALSRL